MQTYHYFEIVYVKVIFLHVGCCYFVFRNALYQFFFSYFLSFFVLFYFFWKKNNSLCVETCHIENVVRTKAKKKKKIMFIFLGTFFFFFSKGGWWGSGIKAI